MTSETRIYFYPLWLRIWHGINALSIIMLIFTGIRMQYSDLVFLGIDFGTAVSLHNIFGIVVSISYFFFFFGNIFTSNKRFYKLKPKGLVGRVKKQAIFYISGIFKGEEPPFPLSEKRKFNPLQKYSYIIVMYLFMPFLIVSGIALLFPELIIEKVYSFSGIFLTAFLHAGFGFLVSIFLIVHLYVASIGKSPLDNFRSILNGYHHIAHKKE